MDVELASRLGRSFIEAEGSGQGCLGRQKSASVDVAKWACFQLGRQLWPDQGGEY